MGTDLAIYETAGLSCGCNHDMDSKINRIDTGAVVYCNYANL